MPNLELADFEKLLMELRSGATELDRPASSSARRLIAFFGFMVSSWNGLEFRP
jgi:hypothetical protein